MGTNQAQLGEIGRFCYILLQPGWRHVNMSALMQLPQGWAPLPQFMGLGGLYRRYGGTIPGSVSTHCGACRSSSSIKASRKTAMKRVRIVTRQLPLLRLMPPHRRWDNLENCRIGSAIFADHKYRDRGNFEWHVKCPNPLWPSLGFRGYSCSNFENKAAFHRCGP